MRVTVCVREPSSHRARPHKLPFDAPRAVPSFWLIDQPFAPARSRLHRTRATSAGFGLAVEKPVREPLAAHPLARDGSLASLHLCAHALRLVVQDVTAPRPEVVLGAAQRRLHPRQRRRGERHAACRGQRRRCTPPVPDRHREPSCRARRDVLGVRAAAEAPVLARTLEPRGAPHRVVIVSARSAWICHVSLHAQKRSALRGLRSSESACERLPGARPRMSGYPLMRSS